jgi:hypothetical protein
LNSFADSNDAGLTWNHHHGADFPYFLRVNGISAIPEAGHALLLTAAACTMAFRRRLR